MSWLSFVLIGQLFLAIALAIDKIFLSNIVKSGAVFALLVGALSVCAFVLVPFGVHLPSMRSLIINVLVGVFLSVGLLLFFIALSRDDATRIGPYIGGVTPIATLIASFIILHELLPRHSIAGIALLIIGSVILLSATPKEKRARHHARDRVLTYVIATAAAIAFALSLVLGRLQFLSDGFVTSFFWQRGGTMLVAIGLAFQPPIRRGAREAIKKLWGAKGLLFFLSKGLGALGYMAMSYATKLTSATVVNALQGVEYIFLLVLAFVATHVQMRSWKEHTSASLFVRKLCATLCIAGGIALVAFM